MTPQGNILINSDFEATVPEIREARSRSSASSSPIRRFCSAATPTAITWKAMPCVKENTAAQVMGWGRMYRHFARCAGRQTSS